MIDHLLSYLAPHPCCSCGRFGALLCSDCKSYIKKPNNNDCPLCGAQGTPSLCVTCRKHVNSIYIVGARTGPLQLLIGSLKFRYARAAASEIAQLLDERIPSLPDRAVLVPIPTSPAHQRERGYDHMQLIAERFSSRRGLILRPLLRHTGPEYTQHHLGRKARQQAVHAAFYVDGELETSHHYVLIDDILTTGSTLRAAALCLRRHGARRIIVVAVARQPSTRDASSVKIGNVHLER